jgi:hypothetical protein
MRKYCDNWMIVAFVAISMLLPVFQLTKGLR